MTKRARLTLATLAALAWPLAPAAQADTHGPRLGGGRIGVQVQAMTPELRRHFDAPADRGLLVTRVEPGRPGAEAGVEVGDVILEVGGEAQRRPFDLLRVVGRAPAGEKLPLRLLRRGKTRRVDVVPTGPATPWPDPAGIAEWLERGMQLGSKELREQLRVLERHLEELEKRLQEEKEIREGAERT
ncbi:MAG: PDZ domain-containing protein [Deltaproteobacteria bacterium]|nr:PDZ domain-containing protein [Deltaproteobacteria bacterium]MBW2448127.1 PDZ domain-containing protein [Deltaproteobacteria bacterium]